MITTIVHLTSNISVEKFKCEKCGKTSMDKKAMFWHERKCREKPQKELKLWTKKRY